MRKRFYQSYLFVNTRLGRLFQPKSFDDALEQPTSRGSLSEYRQVASDEVLRQLGREGAVWHNLLEADQSAEIDRLASELGNKYRGTGVIIGTLAVGIIVCGVTPFALQLGASAALAAGMLEIVFMLATLFLIFHTRRTRLKQRWVALRQYSEELRYVPLRRAMEDFERRVDPGAFAALKSVLQTVLGEQAKWNHDTAHKYEAIEHFAHYFTWAGFLTALVFSLFHLLFHQGWFAYFTIVLPVTVGVVHGTNSFLQIAELQDQYEKKHVQLSELLELLATATPSDAARMVDDAGLSKIALRAYSVLTRSDVQWSKKVLSTEIRPA